MASLILLCFAAASAARSQDPLPDVPLNLSFELKIFETAIVVNRYQSAEKKKHGLRFVALHHDEQTGLRVAKEIVQERGGILYELVSTRNGSPARDLYFEYKQHEYRIDPNRFFTSAGITKNLRKRTCAEVFTEGVETKLSCSWARPEFEDFVTAVPEILRFSDKLLKMITPDDKDGAIVSVHNNSDRGFSLGSYTHGGEEWRSSERGVFYGKEDLDNFFLVTNEALFRKLFEHKAETWDFNIVLQKQPPNPDDGSLSIYAGRHRLNYILVEAESYAGAERQRQMINRLIDTFEKQD